MEPNAVVELRNVSIYHTRDSFKEASFRKKRDNCDLVLSDVNLTVRPGELVYLIGRVGSGKSSLMKPCTPNCRWSKAKGGSQAST